LSPIIDNSPETENYDDDFLETLPGYYTQTPPSLALPTPSSPSPIPIPLRTPSPTATEYHSFATESDDDDLSQSTSFSQLVQQTLEDPAPVIVSQQEAVQRSIVTLEEIISHSPLVEQVVQTNQIEEILKLESSNTPRPIPFLQRQLVTRPLPPALVDAEVQAEFVTRYRQVPIMQQDV
jgi:hypothetical protein